jgi:hypothetical protein
VMLLVRSGITGVNTGRSVTKGTLSTASTNELTLTSRVTIKGKARFSLKRYANWSEPRSCPKHESVKMILGLYYHHKQFQ